MSRHRYRSPLRWSDVDAQGHLGNSAYLDHLQDARVDFLLAGPPELAQLLAHGVLVVGHAVEYLAPVRYGERPLDVDLWVDELGGSRFSIGYAVWDGPVLAARARTAAVPFDLRGGGLRRLRPVERMALAAALEPTEPLRPLPADLVPGALHRYPLVVRWSDLDSYGHVNNVRYADYLQAGRLGLLRRCLGEPADGAWVVARQDLAYRRPMDHRAAPYEVRTTVVRTGKRSVVLAAEVRDPATGAVHATGRTVVVAPAPLTPDQRSALAGPGELPAADRPGR